MANCSDCIAWLGSSKDSGQAFLANSFIASYRVLPFDAACIALPIVNRRWRHVFTFLECYHREQKVRTCFHILECYLLCLDVHEQEFGVKTCSCMSSHFGMLPTELGGMYEESWLDFSCPSKRSQVVTAFVVAFSEVLSSGFRLQASRVK